MSRSRGGVAAIAMEAFVALALFGCIPVAVKYVHANAYTIGIVRLGVATAFVLAATAIRRELRPLPRRDVIRLAVIGTLFFAHWLTYFLSIKISSVAIGAIGLSTYGVDLLILGALAGHGRSASSTSWRSCWPSPELRSSSRARAAMPFFRNAGDRAGDRLATAARAGIAACDRRRSEPIDALVGPGPTPISWTGKCLVSDDRARSNC